MAEQRRIVTAAPENSETPLDALCAWVTPNRLFFVRSHFDVPEIDPDAWRLSIEGLVERSQTLRLADLEGLPQHSVFTTVECAGNGRSFLEPHEHGVQWGAGAIAHAEWTGVRLRDVLEMVAVQSRATHLVCEGADQGRESGMKETVPFARSLPMAKAFDDDTLLALRMNGEPLAPSHGFPVRLLVPGWYGVASVKWLSRIEASDVKFDGYYQTHKYTIQRQVPHGTQTVELGPMPIKSEIVRPRQGEAIAPGPQRVFGVAWAGEEGVAAVDISVDGGQTWHPAKLVGIRARYSWTLWEWTWRVEQPGEYQVLARATSVSGDSQPLDHDRLRGGYMINFVRPRNVRVVEAAPAAARPAATAAEALVYDMNAFAEENAARPLDVELEFVQGAGI